MEDGASAHHCDGVLTRNQTNRPETPPSVVISPVRSCRRRRAGTTFPFVIVWLAVVLWLVIVAWSLALMRAAGSAEGKTKERPERPAGTGSTAATTEPQAQHPLRRRGAASDRERHRRDPAVGRGAVAAAGARRPARGARLGQRLPDAGDQARAHLGRRSSGLS